MVTLGIRSKILILIMAATIIPLLSLNIYWTNSQRQSLKEATRSRQTLATHNDANSVNAFLDEKVRALIIHSQSASLQQQNTARASLELSTLLYQDKDLSRVALVDQNGQETVALTGDLKTSSLKNVQSTDAFKVVNYFAGNQYISPVTTDSKGHPTITIAVPLIAFTTPQELGTLSTAEAGVVRNPDDIKGALIAQVSLENLWSTVLSTNKSTNDSSTPNDGYAYVVDDKGAIIAHQDGGLVDTHKNVSSVPIVALFKSNLGSSGNITKSVTGISEKGVQVAATYESIPATKWAVIFEEPVSSIYQSVNHVSRLGLALSAAAIIIMAVLSYALSRYSTTPILRVAKAAQLIGQGTFGTRVNLRRNDEIGQLGDSINAMGENLQGFIARIETQRHQLEVILNSTADGIMSVDQEGAIQVANMTIANLAGRPLDSLAGRRVVDVLPWTRQAKRFVVDYQANGTRSYEDLEYTRDDGTVHYVNVIVVKASDQAIVTIHDITKSRELEDMKVDFVSMAAHELRTPLSRIKGYLELATAQPDSAANEQVRAFIAQSHRSAMELSTLISNLLDVSRIEKGNLLLTMDKVDFAEVVNQAVRNFVFTAEANDITLDYTGPHHDHFIIGDTVAIREVVDNLVDNAIKYTAAKGHVTVSFTQEGSSYIINVEDNGQGIPANALPYLFTKFYRVHGGLESGSGGTGLGLFITKSIIERHNGSIAVKSIEGQGSTFTVTLPIFNEATFINIQKAEGAEHVSKRRGWTTTNIAR